MAQLDKIRLSGTTYDIVDSTAIHSLDGYWTTGETTNAITAATNALAESIAEQGYQTSGDVQNAISGKAENSDLTAHTSNTSIHVTSEDKTAWNAKADISDIPSVSGYADSVMYNSTTKYVEFYHGGTGGTVVFSYDASPFLIDGMVESVVITSVTSGQSEVQVLEITWNSAAGGQVTDIPLSDIFDPSNYYTKSQIDTTVSGLTDRMAEDEEVTAAGLNALNASLSGKASQSDLETVSGDVATVSGTVSTKQDLLVSGTNIKTINNTSLLGSGNITIQGGNQVEVSGTTLVFL